MSATPIRELVDWRPYSGDRSVRWASGNFRLGNPYTGSVKSGWCLYEMRGSCWNQASKAEFPPVEGMVPTLTDGQWVWRLNGEIAGGGKP